MYASILHKGASVSYTWPAGRAGYIHVADTQGSSLAVNDIILHGGDGAFVSAGESVTITGAGSQSEFVLFDMLNAQ